MESYQIGKRIQHVAINTIHYHCIVTVCTMSLPSYKLALVTGASAGIGRAVAVQLAARGIKVIIIVMMMMIVVMMMVTTR